MPLPLLTTQHYPKNFEELRIDRIVITKSNGRGKYLHFTKLFTFKA